MYQEPIIVQDQRRFLSGLYNLETIRDEQEETEEYVQNNFKKVVTDDR